MSDHVPSAKLRMANDIVRQWAHLSAQERSVRLAQHVNSFWEPRMHVRFETQVAAAGDTCDPVIVEAVRLLVGP
ncbi:MAG: formate dehydrogenase subunit delta [Nocardioides sp.]|uniref:formate dehydrogenase subunit delta n=1 Tax=Nocardioides sp. TaxID=35761 RepID=UPI0039E38594